MGVFVKIGQQNYYGKDQSFKKGVVTLKNVIATVALAALLVSGCGSTGNNANVNANTNQPTNQRKNQQSNEVNSSPLASNYKPTRKPISKNEEKEVKLKTQNELNELLGHSAYTIGAALSHNYFGEIGDGILWLNAQRTILKLDYLKFHKLYGNEILKRWEENEPLGELWKIDEAYLGLLNAMKTPNDRFTPENKEKLKDSFGFFSEYLTEETFKKYCSSKNKEEKFKQFKKYAANNFEWEKGLFE